MRTEKFMLPCLLCLLALTTIASAQSAEQMLSSCKWIENAKVSGDDVAIPRDFESGECWGAFGVVQNVIWVADPSQGRRLFEVCAPSESSRTQLIAIFVDYVKHNPKTMSDKFFFTARAALANAFPCAKTQANH
jgi:hypothetical protein